MHADVSATTDGLVEGGEVLQFKGSSSLAELSNAPGKQGRGARRVGEWQNAWQRTCCKIHAIIAATDGLVEGGEVLRPLSLSASVHQLNKGEGWEE